MSAIDLQLSNNADEVNPRDTMQAIRRGASRKCPACGEGKLFRGYLKLRDECPACHEEIFHHRADDGPAYLTVLVLAHLLVPVMMFVFFKWHPSPMVMLGAFSLFTIVTSLILLPIFKGGLVGLQWGRRMHGFDEAAPQREVRNKI